jgi:hypothetical protein
MEDALRIVLQLALVAAGVTMLAAAAAWWFESSRRLKRTLKQILGGAPDAQGMDPGQGRAAGLRFDARQLAILWDKGASGLVYGFDEIDGAELIVDGHVEARVMRGEAKKPLDALGKDADQVTLRLIFADARFPEFELDLWGAQSAYRNRGETPADAVRTGRRWLAHIDAVLKRARAAPPVRVEEDEDDED